MHQDDPGLEQRLSRFEAQLDRFSLALHQWQTQDRARAGSFPDVDERIRTIEDALGREALALRQMHEEPLKQLQAQAASLKDLCEAATSSMSGLDQAESRLAEFQGTVGVLLSDVSRSLQALVADLRSGPIATVNAPGPAAAWPLERVVHLHDELRRSGNGTSGEPPRELADETSSARLPSEHQARERSLDHEPRRGWLYAAAAAVIVAVVLGTIFVALRIEARLDEAAARVASAEQQVVATTQLASREVAAARQDADRQIAEARQLAQRAETVGAILTAPDLVRLNLTSASADGSSAQLLWSRTRGLVLSGSRLPAVPAESTYQLWLVTALQSFSAGLFVPDAAGRATLVTDAPPKVAGAVVGATVTVEPSGGRPTPSGRMQLSRLPQPQ
jgi:hypothetical protein